MQMLVSACAYMRLFVGAYTNVFECMWVDTDVCECVWVRTDVCEWLYRCFGVCVSICRCYIFASACEHSSDRLVSLFGGFTASITHRQSHTHSHALTRTHMHSYTHTHMHSLSHTLTLTCIHKRSHTLTRTHAHSHTFTLTPLWFGGWGFRVAWLIACLLA